MVKSHIYETGKNHHTHFSHEERRGTNLSKIMQQTGSKIRKQIEDTSYQSPSKSRIKHCLNLHARGKNWICYLYSHSKRKENLIPPVQWQDTDSSAM